MHQHSLFSKIRLTDVTLYTTEYSRFLAKTCSEPKFRGVCHPIMCLDIPDNKQVKLAAALHIDGKLNSSIRLNSIVSFDCTYGSAHDKNECVSKVT